MAKSDSSAVQKLIELAQQKSLELDVDLDGLFIDDTSARPARPSQPPPRRGASASMSPSATLPPLPRARAPVSTQTGFPAHAPPQPIGARLGGPPIASTTDPTTDPIDLADITEREDVLPDTQASPRHGSLAPWILAGAFALGVGFAGVYIVAVGLEQAAPAPDRALAAPAPVPIAAAVAAPASAPIVAAAPAPALEVTAPAAPAVAPSPAAAPVTVSFFSRPAGATVVLVENGSMTPLGKTPLTAPLPAGKTHELLFTLEGRATVLAHVDPASKTEVSVELAAGSEPIVAAPVAPSEGRTERAARGEPTKEPRKDSKERGEPKRVAAAGRGTLMLGAKPPCDIVIDGKPTGLTTPQREIPLSAGKHTITLVNAQHGIRKAFAVVVPVGDTVKVVKDFTDLMK